jgi:hypothetical protein
VKRADHLLEFGEQGVVDGSETDQRLVEIGSAAVPKAIVRVFQHKATHFFANHAFHNDFSPEQEKLPCVRCYGNCALRKGARPSARMEKIMFFAFLPAFAQFFWGAAGTGSACLTSAFPSSRRNAHLS